MTRRRNQWKYLMPNSITGLGMFLGLWAILLAIDAARDVAGGALVIAAWWVIVASLMDGLDGAVARMTKTTSNFGVQFDSLADLVTFGVAPAAILYVKIHPWNTSVASGVAAAYLIAGAMRLARFNISAAPTTKKRSFQGLPIPAAAGMLMAFLLCHDHFESFLGAEATRRILPSLALIAAYLMISKIRFQTFKELAFRAEQTPKTATAQVLAFIVLMGWIFFLPHEILAMLIFGGYVVYSVTAALVWRWHLVRRPWASSEENQRDSIPR